MFLRLKTIFLLTTCLTLLACGTTSALIPANTPLVSLDSKHYNKIVVYDFVDKTHKNPKKAQSMRRKKIMSYASQRFADLMALKIEQTGAFQEVSRNSNGQIITDGGYLAVRGEITRYYRGNTFFRVLIGYGIGTAFLDADISLYDAKTNELIGTFEVDKNSWVLGGVLAIAQNIEYFMKGSAGKIAREIAAINHNSVEPVLVNAGVESLVIQKPNQDDLILTGVHQAVQ